MKKLFATCTALLMLLATVGCNNNDDSTEPADTTSPLVGVWRLVELNSSVALDLDNDGDANTSLHVEEPCVLDSEVIFFADGNLTNSPSFVLIPLVETAIACTPVTFDGTWTLAGDQLTLVQAGQTTTGTIILNGDQLTLLDITFGQGGSTIDAVYTREQ